MAISISPYIQRANIQDPAIRYRWDDWDFDEAETPVDPELQAELEKLSLRSNIALAIATAEWVVFRFEAMLDDLLPLDYLEAAWAQEIDFHYGFVWWQPIHDEEWLGPVKGPVREAIAWVMEIIRSVEETEEHPAEMCASLSKLTEHVLSDSTPYQTWRSRVLRRLDELYPFDAADPMGDVVPKEALDPDRVFRLQESETLVNRFLAGADREDNDFLKSAEDMLNEGFEGTPYVFSLADDRRKRDGS
jgi:hypothetical protein